jgi:GNAT superfamily N-acetyltransferase
MQVRSIYNRLNEKAASIVESTGYDGSVEFLFDDYPEVKGQVQALQRQFVGDMHSLIYTGTSVEWKNSNLFQDLVAKKALNYYRAQVRGVRFKHYFQANSDHLKAFQARKDRGLNLSSKLWNQSFIYKESLEATISTAIENGMSAITLSKRLSKYLNDWPSLQKDYQERYAKATRAYDCEYRSIRLARNEINLAYRNAEQLRWQQFDFILGYEVKLSGSHPRYDICDDLKGKYPKEFKWVGWHPSCLCYAIPIVMSEDEYWKYHEDGIMPGTAIKEPPSGVTEWLSENADRVKDARKKGTLPYWIRDNNKYLSSIHSTAFDYNESIREKLSQRGFWARKLISVEAFNDSAMKGFDVLSFDKCVEDMCDKNKISIKIKQLEDAFDGKVSLRYLGRLENGKEFELSRYFRYEEIGDKRIPVVDHKLFVLPDELQGKGISKQLMSAMVEQYEKCGISKAYIHANIDVGGYCWAKYGAISDKGTVKTLIDNAFQNKDITLEEKSLAFTVMERYKDSIPMQKLANLSFGKRMLKGSSWHGYLDFVNDVQKKHLHDYLGIK